MRVTDFMKYLRMREVGSQDSFTFVDTENTEHSVGNVEDVVFYMIDCDLPKYLPGLFSRYTHQFKMSNEILPGGSFCMMNAVRALVATLFLFSLYRRANDFLLPV